MDNLDITNILDRQKQVDNIKTILTDFEKNKHLTNIKRGLYIYGDPGSGKTHFINDVLTQLDYDIITYDAGDIRNKNIMETITRHNMADRNIMCMFQKKVKKIAIIMDEIDGMNQGDKGGINTLIKMIREKKTKKQKQEEITYIPIICIGNYHIDKKIKELMKVCHTIEIRKPTDNQIINIITKIIPNLSTEQNNMMTTFIQGDLRRINHIYSMYKNNNQILSPKLISAICQLKSYNEDTKNITKNLINIKYSIHDHNKIMNETDRTIVGLLWHENIIDVLSKIDTKYSISLYLNILNNICFADYIDRITFQKQIWQFNEMSSIIKTFLNNKVYHEYFENNKYIKKKPLYNPTEVRFTKVLTKYSTEYNNTTFIQMLCHQLGMEKKDLYAFFYTLKQNQDDNSTEEIMLELFNNCNISALDIKRIFRYLDRSIKCVETDQIVEEE